MIPTLLSTHLRSLCSWLSALSPCGGFPNAQPARSLGCFAETTQIEDPRVQWRREQEHMLKDYLVVAQEALSAQKETYQVKQRRLELAQREYQQLHAAWEHRLGSQVSCEYPQLAT